MCAASAPSSLHISTVAAPHQQNEGGTTNQQSISPTGRVINGVSFADKVRASSSSRQAIEISNLPNPSFRGDYPVVKLPKRAYQRGLDFCKFSLLAKMDLQQEKLDEIRSQAAEVWKPQGNWNFIPMARGFVHVRFEKEMDFDRVWSGGPWKIGNQLVRLNEWTKNFKPELFKQTNAMVWVKFPNLPIECWDEESVLSIGKGVGYPVRVDKATLNKDFGFYAQVLVDVDFSKAIPEQILVETEDSEFWQDVVIPKMPKFCNHCRIVGHLVSECNNVRAECGKIKEPNGKKLQTTWRSKVGNAQDVNKDTGHAVESIEKQSDEVVVISENIVESDSGKVLINNPALVISAEANLGRRVPVDDPRQQHSTMVTLPTGGEIDVANGTSGCLNEVGNLEKEIDKGNSVVDDKSEREEVDTSTIPEVTGIVGLPSQSALPLSNNFEALQVYAETHHGEEEVAVLNHELTVTPEGVKESTPRIQMPTENQCNAQVFFPPVFEGGKPPTESLTCLGEPSSIHTKVIPDSQLRLNQEALVLSARLDLLKAQQNLKTQEDLLSPKPSKPKTIGKQNANPSKGITISSSGRMIKPKLQIDL